MMLESIGAILLMISVFGILFGFICMMLGDTYTFRAIDERIARLIKGGKDDE